jgi:HK97 family phage portal protein
MLWSISHNTTTMKWNLKGLVRRIMGKSWAVDEESLWWGERSGSDTGFIVPELVFTDWVAAAIRVRGKAVASSKFDLYKKQSGKETVVDTHPLLTLLNDVNPYYTKYTLLQRMSYHLDIFGNEYWWIVRGADKKPYEIFPLDPRRITVIRDKDPTKYVTGYLYRLESGGSVAIPAKDILHFKEMDPCDDLLGKSIVETSSDIIMADKYLRAWSRNYFKNNAMPDMALEIPRSLNEDQVESIKQDWINNYAGINRKNGVAVLHSGVKIQAMQKSVADMQVTQQLDSNRDNVLGLFGTSKNLLGFTDDVNLASAKTTDATFTKRTVLPILVNFAVTINEYLLYQFEDNQDDTRKEAQVYELRPVIEAVSDLENTQRNQLMFSNKIITINEWRASEGLPRIDGGDSFYGSTVVEEKPEEDIEDDLEEDEIKSAVLMATKREIENYKATNPDAVIKEEPPQENEQVPSEEPDKREALRGRLVKQTRMNEEDFESNGVALKAAQDGSEEQGVKEIEKAVTGLIEDQIKRAMKNVRAPEKALSKLLDKDREVKATIDLLTPIIKGILMREGKRALDKIDVDDVKWNDKLPSVRSYLKNNTKKLAGSMTDTTIEAIRSAVADGLEAEEGIEEIKQRVMSAGELGPERATNIALSETHRATGYAELEAFKASDVVVSKIWFTAEDERVCEDCDMMNGTEVPIDQPFLTVTDLSDIDIADYDGGVETAMLHPQCRCTVIPVIK